MRYILFLLIAFISCNQNDANSTGLNRDHVIDISSNSQLIERRYYSNEKKINSIIFFDRDSPIEEPVDSIVFLYNSSDQIENIITYNYIDERYQKNTNSVDKEHFMNIFSTLQDCSNFKSLTSSYLLINELSDICNITNSVLPNGKDMKILEKVNYQGKNKVLTYDGINARFNGLSLDLQSFFYDQKLNKLTIVCDGAFISSDTYYFQNGSFKRNYNYRDGKLIDIKIEVTYNDGTTQHILKHFSDHSN